MTPTEIELRRSAADDYKAAKALVDSAETAARSMTTDEVGKYDQFVADGDAKRERAERLAAVSTRDSEFVAPEPKITPAQVTEPVRDDSAGDVTISRAADSFLRSDALKSFRQHGYRGQAAVELDGMSLRAVVDNTVGSGGAFQNPTRVPNNQLAVPNRMLHIIDLLPHGNTNDNSVEYVQDTTTSAVGDTAVEVAEGAVKPESTATFAVVTDPVRTIATWMNITRQAAEDNDQLNSYLQGQLVYRVQRRLDNQILNGDGVGANLLGLANRTGILTYAPITAEARVLSVRRAITLLEQNEQEANAVILNPADMERFDLTLASGSGEFLAGPGYVRETGTLWGLRPVWSNAIAAGTALVLDTSAAMVWDRRQPTLYLTDSHASNFTSNILTMLMELRAALSVFQPKGIAKITFNGTV